MYNHLDVLGMDTLTRDIVRVSVQSQPESNEGS